MNEMELAQLFVAYRAAMDEAAKLEKQIQEAVLERADSQKIAGVKATYYQPSVDYDYEAAAKCANVLESTVQAFTTMKPVVSWKGVCEAAEVPLDGFGTVKPARVVVKVV